MMHSGDARKSDDATSARQFNGAHDRGVAPERHVGSVLVAIRGMQSDQAQEVPLA
jgi:hypothetical protein